MWDSMYTCFTIKIVFWAYVPEDLFFTPVERSKHSIYTGFTIEIVFRAYVPEDLFFTPDRNDFLGILLQNPR